MTGYNLYHLAIKGEGSTAKVSVRARNKVEAITKGVNMIYGWRNKDRIEDIKITEDVGNRELTQADYL